MYIDFFDKFSPDLDFPHGIGAPAGYGPPGAPPGPAGHMVPPGPIGGGVAGGDMPTGAFGGPPGAPGQLTPVLGPDGYPVPAGPGGPGTSLLPQFECPARPNFGTVGKRIDLRANHFQIKMPKDYIHHYDVTIQVRTDTHCRFHCRLHSSLRWH